MKIIKKGKKRKGTAHSYPQLRGLRYRCTVRRAHQGIFNGQISFPSEITRPKRSVQLSQLKVVLLSNDKNACQRAALKKKRAVMCLSTPSRSDRGVLVTITLSVCPKLCRCCKYVSVGVRVFHLRTWKFLSPFTGLCCPCSLVLLRWHRAL